MMLPITMVLVVQMSAGQPSTGVRGLGSARVEASSGAVMELQTHYAERLEELRADSPEMYLLLGEEVLDRATTPADRRLALDLFVRAYEYATTGTAAPQESTARSAVLALVSMSESVRERQGISPIAERFQVHDARSPLASDQETIGSEAVDAQVATLIGYVRSGDGALARQLLRKTEVSNRLQSLNPRLARAGYDRGARGLEREASRWPCGECSNLGIIRRPSGWKACPECGGTPGPDLSSMEERALLSVELWLLRGVGVSWATQVYVDDGQPMKLDASVSPAEVFGVDVKKSRWLDGAWVMPSEPAKPTEDPLSTTPASDSSGAG